MARVKRNLLCLNQESIEDICSKSSVVNKRYVSPVYTDKTSIFELGVSFTGLKHILVQLGFDAFEVDDIIDLYDKESVMYVQKNNGKNSSYINMRSLITVIRKVLDILDANRQMTSDEMVIGMVYQLCEGKVGYIQNKIDGKIEELDNKSKCKSIINKYNLHNNVFYGNQQRNIWREICNELDVNLSFSSCLKEFGIDYRWVGKAPYHVTHGEEWGVCEIILG
ncbi:MAG: hypothetical protein ACRC18_06790 [Cetobacterium sp.]